MRLLSFYVRAGDATISFTEVNLGVSLLRSCGWLTLMFKLTSFEFLGSDSVAIDMYIHFPCFNHST